MEITQAAEFILWYLAFIISITLHEAAHSFASMKMGDRTAYNAGQVTLNPIPHIKREPFGTVLIPIITFAISGWMIGWASAPYNINWAFTHPKKAAAMAAAGPMANFLLVIFAAILIHIGIYAGVFINPESISITSVVVSVDEGLFSLAAQFISILFSLNLILFVFNLMPVPPLDGSGIIPLYLSDDLSRKYMSIIHKPAVAFIGIFIAWKLFGMFYFEIHLVFINLLYPFANYQ